MKKIKALIGVLRQKIYQALDSFIKFKVYCSQNSHNNIIYNMQTTNEIIKGFV